jgi:hypothetical protein
MIYIPQWESLSNAAKRVSKVANISEAEARTSICQAVADGVIKIRAKLDEQTIRHLTSREVLEGSCFRIPTNLHPEHLDWENSRPLKPWDVRRGSFIVPGPWRLKWMKLFGPDVTSILCTPSRTDNAGPASSGEGKKKKGQPTFDRADRAIRQLYPQGVPDQSTLPNATLCKEVGAKLKELEQPDVSDDTILRASGRRQRR